MIELQVNLPIARTAASISRPGNRGVLHSTLNLGLSGTSLAAGCQTIPVASAIPLTAVASATPLTTQAPVFRLCDAKAAFRFFVFAVLIGGWFQSARSLHAQVQSDEKRVEAVVETRAKNACFVIKNLQDPVVATVRVWPADANIVSSPSMMGAALVVDGDLVFTPRFPVRPAAVYVVHVQPIPNSKPSVFRVEVPGKSELKASVVGFFPSSDRLPENMLKFYVQFSSPMQKGDIYRYVRLREVDGHDIELPFLEIEQEFWSRDSKRLTLLLDPGRIKRGLKPREEMGPILEAGKSYELVVDGRWPDANGDQLGSEFVKRFLAVAEDHSQPDPNQWKIRSPVAGTRQPLKISFPGSLDHAMLFGSIRIVHSNSNPVAGTVKVSDHETQWAFLPDQDWESATYQVFVNKDLEDNAGNSIGRPFDVDLFNKTESSDAAVAVEIEFKVSK